MDQYDKGAKACVKNYNLKTFYSKRMQKFFGSGTDESLDETPQIKKLDLGKPFDAKGTIDSERQSLAHKSKDTSQQISQAGARKDSQV